MEYIGNGYFRMILNGQIIVGTPEDLKIRLEETIKFYEKEMEE